MTSLHTLLDERKDPLAPYSCFLMRLAYDKHLKASLRSGSCHLVCSEPDLNGSNGLYRTAFAKLLSAGLIHLSSLDDPGNPTLGAFQPTTAGIKQLFIMARSESSEMGEPQRRPEATLETEKVRRHGWVECRSNIRCEATQSSVGSIVYAYACLEAAERSGTQLAELISYCPFQGFEEIAQDQWGYEVGLYGLSSICPTEDELPQKVMVIHQVKVNALNLGRGFGSVALTAAYQSLNQKSILCFLNPFPLNYSYPSADPGFTSGIRAIEAFYNNCGFTSFDPTKKTMVRYIKNYDTADRRCEQLL